MTEAILRKRGLLRVLARMRRLAGRKAETRRRVAITILCVIAGLVCSLAPYEVRPGIHMFFGGAASMLAALVAGPWFGAAAALLTYGASVVLTGHFLWVVVGVAEAALVGAVACRLKKAASGEALFWVAMSVTLLAVAGMNLIQHEAVDPWAVVLKTPINSLTNLSLAILGVNLMRAWQKPRKNRRELVDQSAPLRSVRTHLFAMTILAALAPLTVLLVEQGKRLERDKRAEARLVQEVATRQVAQEIGLTIRLYRQAVLAVAGEIDLHQAWRSEKVGGIAEILERCRAVNREFLTMLATDGDGNIIGVSPAFNSQGQRLTGRESVADRDYFRVPRETGMHYLSGGFEGRGFGKDRIAAVSAPIQNAGKQFRGVVEGSISLDRFTLPEGAFGHQRTLILLDAAGKVLSASPNSGFRPLDDAATHPELSPLFTSDGFLISRQGVTDTGWTLVVLRPLSALATEMESYYRTTGLGMAAATVVCLLLLRLIARMIARPIDEILRHLRLFPPDAPTPADIQLSRWTPRELEELASDFSRLSVGLATSYSDLTDSLEERLRLNQELTRMVSQMKQKATELAEAKSGSEAASRVKSAFLTNISHEVRTPLNGLLGMLGILLEGPLEEDQRRKATIAQESATALLGLVSDVLNFSSLSGGTAEIDSVEFYPSAVVEEVVSISQRHAAEKELTLVSYVDPKAKRKYKGDPGKLREALSHLANNALKFTARGSVRVALTCRNERDGYTTFKYEVSDTGIGIPHDQLGRVFEPFTQADGSTTRRHGGAGLGLALVKQIAHRIGGTIGVKSEAGIGSVFWITVELARAGESDEPAPPPPEAGQIERNPGEERRRILVVEDNPVNQKVVCRMLQKAGYLVVLAGDGRQALVEVDRAGPFDVILMDCQMPVMDGYDATAEIRRREGTTRRTPIIATTANAMEGDRELCLRAGMDDYVAKPIDRARLLAIVERYAPEPVRQ
ncbi:MAG: response regulator [Acidobacteria bacterium]|nr:response regulator [Acidobacteriota bacterium]